MSRRAGVAHCAVSSTHWSQYLDGEFSSTECRRCEAHLEHCAECRDRLREVRRTVRACREQGRVPLPADLRVRARERARAVLAGRSRSRQRR